jgi:UDP-N-acetyl-D-mannosaminuronate dehydrogenase
MVIVFESITYPGTTREMLLMQFAGNTRRAGK